MVFEEVFSRRQIEARRVADGAADLEEVFDWFSLKPPEQTEDEDFDSVGGMITSRLGRIPREGEEIQVEYGGLVFRVLRVGERRIERVFCRPAEEKE